MNRQHKKTIDSEIINTEARERTISQLLGVYIIVCAVISASWAIGHYDCSFLWVFLLICGLFILWKTKLTNIIQNRLYKEEIRIHRKRALRQSETAEWLNFIVNRWWVFNADTIEELVKKKLEERLFSIKPSYLDKLQLQVFTFGDHTPSIKYIRTFEYSDGVPGGRKPVSWVNVNTPPTGLDKVSSYQIVCEVETQNLLDEFQMVFAASVGRGRASLGFKIAVEQLRISGVLQIVLHMSKDIPFPHISKASMCFIDKPEVQFNLNVLKAVNLTELPLLKNWIYDQVMEGIAIGLVDPGQVSIPISRVGAVQMKKPAEKKIERLAQGVLTIHILGTAVRDGDTEDVRYSTLRLGDQKRTTHDELAINDWDDICSFFVFNLKREKIILKSKCHRLLSNVTLQQHEIQLASFPFEVNQNLNTTVENNDGSTYELRMQYTPLPQIDIENPITNIQIHDNKSGVMYICIHGASNLIGSDRNGSSDPYCVAFCDRRRVLTTPFIKNTVHPRWESSKEFFVKDFTSVMLSFYVFDWDGTNIIEDDFLGSAFFTMSEEEPVVIKKTLTLGYNKSSDGYVTDASYGQIFVSVVFRPVASVEKSEKYRVASLSEGGKKDYLYNEDLVSPSSAPTKSRSSFHQAGQGGGPNHKTNRGSLADVLPTTKTMVDLTILQGRDLVAMDRNGFSDPFCVVKMGEKRLLKTTVQKKTLFPKWNESTTFEVKDGNQMIEIMMYDKDLISNDFLGKVLLSMDKLKEISYKNAPEWIKLQRTKSGMLQIRCTVTTNGVPMQRDNEMNGTPENDVFRPELLAASQSSPSKQQEEAHPKVDSWNRRDMKPDILPQVDQLDSRHRDEVIVKQETKVTFQQPLTTKSHADKGSPASAKKTTAMENGTTESSPSLKRNQQENLPQQNTNKQGTQKLQTENLLAPEQIRHEQRRGRSSSQQLISTQQYDDAEHRYFRHSSPQHSRRTSKETLIDDSPALSPVTPPFVQKGRRARSNSENLPLMRSQSDMTVNAKPGHHSLMVPERNGRRLNAFPYELDDSSVGSVESGSTIGHEKMYSVSGEVKAVRGLPKSVSNFYCKIKLQNPHTRFRFGSNTREIGKSQLVKADNPVVNTKFEVDRGSGTSVDALLIFDIKDGKKHEVAQHSFTIGLLFMDYEEGGVTKWLSLGHHTGVEVLVSLTKGNPNPRMMRKKHTNSMRMPGERHYAKDTTL